MARLPGLLLFVASACGSSNGDEGAATDGTESAEPTADEDSDSTDDAGSSTEETGAGTETSAAADLPVPPPAGSGLEECADFCSTHLTCPDFAVASSAGTNEPLRHPNHFIGPVWDDCFFECLGTTEEATLQCRYDAKVFASCVEFNRLFGCGIAPPPLADGPCGDLWPAVRAECP